MVTLETKAKLAQVKKEDKAKKERVEAANQAEGIVHDVETKIAEYESQLPGEEVTKIKDLITKTREALAKKDEFAEAIKNGSIHISEESWNHFKPIFELMSEIMQK